MRESIKNVFLLVILYAVVFTGRVYFRLMKANNTFSQRGALLNTLRDGVIRAGLPTSTRSST